MVNAWRTWQAMDLKEWLDSKRATPPSVATMREKMSKQIPLNAFILKAVRRGLLDIKEGWGQVNGQPPMFRTIGCNIGETNITPMDQLMLSAFDGFKASQRKK
jgi:hypothetical protein